jgi:hypothetical protein
MISIVCTIEPEARQFIGATLLRSSLVANCAKPFDFRLTIIRRGSDETLLADLADSLGIKVRLAHADHPNGFLNKWPGLAAHTDLRAAKHVACLDWDMLLVRRCSFPEPFLGSISARPNPPDLYAARLAALKQRMAGPPLIQSNFHVPSSINGGVLIGSEKQLRQCGQATIRYENLIGSYAGNWELWEREQLALSLAVGEIGLRPLEPAWNATQRAAVPPKEICLWHYNDGWNLSWRLKRCLHRPVDALALLREMRTTHPGLVAVFLQFYARILDEPWFMRMTELGASRSAA